MSRESCQRSTNIKHCTLMFHDGLRLAFSIQSFTQWCFFYSVFILASSCTPMVSCYHHSTGWRWVLPCFSSCSVLSRTFCTISGRTIFRGIVMRMRIRMRMMFLPHSLFPFPMLKVMHRIGWKLWFICNSVGFESHILAGVFPVELDFWRVSSFDCSNCQCSAISAGIQTFAIQFFFLFANRLLTTKSTFSFYSQLSTLNFLLFLHNFDKIVYLLISHLEMHFV